MTKFLTAILAAFLLALSVSAQAEQIVWENDYKKALATARESGRPLLLDFTAPWCKPCKAMDERFWVLPEVIKMTKPFVAVKVDFDNEKGLVGKYNVSAIPYVIFADPLGNLITFRRGFGEKNANELNLILNEMPKDFSVLKKYYEALELKKNDGLALLQIADSYRVSKMLTLSSDFYEKALKTPEIQSDAEKKERINATLGLNAYRVEDFKQANNRLEDYLKDFPAGKYREISIAALAISYAKIGKIKNAEKYLELLKTEFPASKNIEGAGKTIEAAKNKPGK